MDRKKGNIYLQASLTAISAMVAETATFPIDITKTRLQLYGESISAASRAHAFRTAIDIVKGEGLMGLYKGLSPALIRHLFYTPIRIACYENLRNAAPEGNKALIGGVSGILGQIVASPADLIKVRLQADGRLVNQGLQPRYKGTMDALITVVRIEGFWGLWKGVFPNVQRAFLVNMGELAIYDHAKQLILRKQICDDNIYAHTLSSIMSGLSATTLSCPADVVKTRMMNQSTHRECTAVYRNSFDCLMKTVKIEGIWALWKGFFPTWARLGPWQFMFWVSYEKLRSLAGLSSF
ncbi:hypothetical protein AMTRI_Chr04g190640 [Amborella trichopoda]|uniref:Uncoupling protein 3 n=1 Tax=Amborella trichopoda TaxID=13333 RepID=W1NGE4_AMBTC|nr:mitochondrial uncoupling protein 3 [Amborella trichopoda]ERM94556.1 hypothetical protein AMTR_s00010p00266970 [Amborella trichopoda]|eukprot:XP_006827319.3 mitochondrial uncoupling protein 3 [Amborella trichopoda]